MLDNFLKSVVYVKSAFVLLMLFQHLLVFEIFEGNLYFEGGNIK